MHQDCIQMILINVRRMPKEENFSSTGLYILSGTTPRKIQTCLFILYKRNPNTFKRDLTGLIVIILIVVLSFQNQCNVGRLTVVEFDKY